MVGGWVSVERCFFLLGDRVGWREGRKNGARGEMGRSKGRRKAEEREGERRLIRAVQIHGSE